MNPTILYLDDHPSELEAHLSAVEERLCASVRIAQTVEQAMKNIETAAPDLCVIDIELGRQDTSGIRFAQQLRLDSRYAQIPILFISMYSHYSRYVLSAIPHSSFLSKPCSPDALTAKIGLLLGIGKYAQQAYGASKLTIPTAHNGFVEMDPHRIRSIELIRSSMILHLTDGQTVTFKSNHGNFKSLLTEIDAIGADHLRQIYRSVIINVHQIKELRLDKNSGEVWLFHDEEPKPVGNRFRHHLSEFLQS